VTFTGPSADERRRWRELVGDPAAHDEIASGLACLTQTDVEPTVDPVVASGWLRLAVWNIERGRDPEAIAALIASSGADAALLSEVDLGMARTRNRDVARELGRELRMGSVYAIEYVELSLGKEADLVGITETENDVGLHGNAVLGRMPLLRPGVVRLDRGGRWFNEVLGEPRVGGQIVVLSTIELDGSAVELASVHLESHSDASDRAAQFTAALDAIDARSTGPAVIAGDLNTFGAEIGELADRTTLRRLLETEPGRFSWPATHEALFDVAAARGYDWIDCNVAAPTTRHAPDGSPHHIPIKLDWILVRGLEARRPTVVPALGPDGTTLSDHELLAVSVRLPQ